MGIKDNFTQAMKELTNPRPSDARKEVRDVASYMNDTADAQPTEPVQAVQNTQPSENEQPEQQAQQSVNPETAGNGFAQQEQPFLKAFTIFELTGTSADRTDCNNAVFRDSVKTIPNHYPF